MRDRQNPQCRYQSDTAIRGSSIQSSSTSTLSRINLAVCLHQATKLSVIAYLTLPVKFTADMSANTMIMASSQSTLANRSASAKPFSGHPIKPTRAVTLPRSRFHVVKAVAKVHYRQTGEQSSPCARLIAQHAWKRSMLSRSTPYTPSCFSLYCSSCWTLKVYAIYGVCIGVSYHYRLPSSEFL